jgi:hypothetical protein
MGSGSEEAEFEGAERDGEDDGEVEGEREAVLAAAGEGSEAKKKDDGGEGVAEAEGSVRATSGGDEVWLFNGLAKGALVAEQEGGERSR